MKKVKWSCRNLGENTFYIANPDTKVTFYMLFGTAQILLDIVFVKFAIKVTEVLTKRAPLNYL